MRFLEVIGGWINRHFSNEEAIYLVVLIVIISAVVFVFGSMLAPVLIGLIVAFLLQGLVKRLVDLGLGDTLAVYLTFTVFLGALIALVLFLVPIVWQQLRALVEGLPNGIVDDDLRRGVPFLFLCELSCSDRRIQVI